MFSRNKLVGLALSLALLAGSGGVFAAQQAEYDRISNEMAGIRELELLEPLDISVQSRDELRDWLLASIEEGYPEDVQQRDQRIMVLFGFIEPGTDLGDLQIDILGEQVAGYYDPETDEMVVVSSGPASDSMSVSDEVTFAHETVHALQDQHFDLVNVQDGSVVEAGDHSLAVTALIEGDATVAQVQYMLAHPTLILGLQNELKDLDSSVLDSAPPYTTGTLLFPYDQGATFITALYNEGGWDLVDQAYTDLPQSTEQIMHPEKYLSGEAPIEVVVNDPLPVLGDDWDILDVSTFGEFVTQLFLDSGEVRPDAAKDAAEGWGGDEYVMVGTDDETALIWSTEWDSDEDAEEFFDILGSHEIKRFDADKADDTGDTVIRFSSDDFSGEIRLDGTNVTYVLGTDQQMVDSLFENQGTEGEPAVEPAASPTASPMS